ncbi:MAG: hypothetical protein ABIA63_09155 [bacterium]
MNPNSSPNSNTRFGVLLVIVGLFIALDVRYDFAIISRVWPVFVMVLGSGLLGIFLKRGRREPGYLGAGIYAVGFSFLAFYLNFTTWARLGQLWPVFIFFLGLVFLALFIFYDKKYVHILLGLMLISLSILFFLLFSLGGSCWWSIFVLTGLSILISEKLHAK